jgi:hypothetical protein
MRERDAVKYLYLDFLAPYAPYRASRVLALFRLCNFVSTFFTIAELFTICTSEEKTYYGDKTDSVETAKNAKIGSEL